jgi:hypothetical protein
LERELRTRLLAAAALVLAIGVIAGTTIYATAEEETAATSYVIVGGEAYAVDPTRTKSYQLQVERFGGKAAILFDEFNRWLAARWQGKALGVTIGWISVGAAALLYWIASRTPR